MKRVAFHTLGCKVNQYETEAITEQFILKGYQEVDFSKEADIYVINTCTVTNMADKKSRKMLSKAKKNNKNAVVVAVGCYVQVAHEDLKNIPYIDVLVGNTHKDKIVSIVEDFIKSNKKLVYIDDVHKDITYEELTIENQQHKTRSTIKIQDGCNQYCSYCIIPYTRGKIRSRQAEDVIKEVKNLANNGFKEIILTGIHLGSYGKDLENVELIQLIEELNKVQGIERIRLGSLEPNFITRDLLVRLVKCETVCGHFHLSMQSGSDTVLKRMNRRYNTADYKEKVDLLREFYTKPSITTDVIVGFPGETDFEESETFAFVENIGFSDLHVFKYSIREGTKAATMIGQVDGNIKSTRSKRLSKLGKELKESYINSFIGAKLTLIVEDIQEHNNVRYYSGHTDNYIKTYIDIKFLDADIRGDLVGKTIDVIIKEVYLDGVIAVI